eukprot:SAG31_NODE_464_length_15318_cov_17.930876_11_plen_325_part_00
MPTVTFSTPFLPSLPDVAHQGCPFCKIAGAESAAAKGRSGNHGGVAGDIVKQRWRRKHKKKRINLKLGKWWRSIGYKGPNYCQRCSELFRDHILRQFSNTAGCTRTTPCCNCLPVLRWFSDTALDVFDHRQRRKTPESERQRQRRRPRRRPVSTKRPVVPTQPRFCDATCAHVLLELGDQSIGAGPDYQPQCVIGGATFSLRPSSLSLSATENSSLEVMPQSVAASSAIGPEHQRRTSIPQGDIIKTSTDSSRIGFDIVGGSQAGGRTRMPAPGVGAMAHISKMPASREKLAVPEVKLSMSSPVFRIQPALPLLSTNLLALGCH